MILKSENIAYSQRLGTYLTTSNKNEESFITEQRGLVVQLGATPTKTQTHRAMMEMDIMAKASSRTKKHIMHIMLNPRGDEQFTASQKAQAWRMYEEEYGLESQPFIESTQIYNGRRHYHRAYLRVTRQGRAVTTDQSYARNEYIARKIEYINNLTPVKGKHNTYVTRRLEEEGNTEMVAWMHAHKLCEGPPAEAAYDKAQHEAFKRNDVDIADIQQDIRSAWEQSDSGVTFLRAVNALNKGYAIAQGNKSRIVLIDQTGTIHNIRRLLGLKGKAGTAALDARFASLTLTSVEDMMNQPQNNTPINDNAEQERGQQQTDLQRKPSDQVQSKFNDAMQGTNRQGSTPPPVADKPEIFKNIAQAQYLKNTEKFRNQTSLSSASAAMRQDWHDAGMNKDAYKQDTVDFIRPNSNVAALRDGL